MSVDRYFKGNFAIFYTDYNKRSINFIYDYAMWRALQENRNVIVFCTTPEKEEELLINPLGIRIADLSYARETEVSKE